MLFLLKINLQSLSATFDLSYHNILSFALLDCKLLKHYKLKKNRKKCQYVLTIPCIQVPRMILIVTWNSKWHCFSLEYFMGYFYQYLLCSAFKLEPQSLLLAISIVYFRHDNYLWLVILSFTNCNWVIIWCYFIW